jgi:hypothetical protein
VHRHWTEIIDSHSNVMAPCKITTLHTGWETLCYPYTDTIIICSSCTNGNGFLINRQRKVIMNVTVIVTLYYATDTYHMIYKVALRIAVASLLHSIISEYV